MTYPPIVVGETLREDLERKLGASVRFETDHKTDSLWWEVRTGRGHAYGNIDPRALRFYRDRRAVIELLFRTLLEGLRDALLDEQIWKRRCLEFVR